MKNYISLLIVLLLAGCATKPQSPAQTVLIPSERVYSSLNLEASENSARVVIVRDQTVSMWGAIGYHQIFLNDRLMASIAAGERLELILKAGEHVFGVIPTLSASTKSEFTGGWAMSNNVQLLESGRTYYFRVLIDGNASSRIQRYFPENP